MRWRARCSLRARLTTAAAVVIAIGLALAAGLLVWRLHATLITGLDDAAGQRARDVAGVIDTRGRAGPVLPVTADTSVLVQVLDAGGQVVAHSANLEAARALFGFPAAAPGADPAARTVTLTAADGVTGSYRVVALPAGSSATPLTVYAAVSTAEADQTVTELSAALVVGGPVLLALLAGTGWLLVGRALRPVEAVRTQTAAITAGGLHQRLALPPARDEIHRLAATVNGLLSRLEAATEQHRRFVADAAHELRGPLAALGAQLEVATAHPARTDWAALVPQVLAWPA